jgi:hypothetical protein
MPVKIFTDDDQSMIFFLVENVFPLLSKKHTPYKTKWLENIIRHNHKWNGFFHNINLTSKENVVKFHTYLLRIISNKRKMIQILESGKMEDDRKRMSKSLKFMFWRLGYMDIDFDHRDISKINYMVDVNRLELSRLYFSDDPTLICHFYLVLGSFYTISKKRGLFNTHDITFSYFVDIAVKFLKANP